MSNNKSGWLKPIVFALGCFLAFGWLGYQLAVSPARASADELEQKHRKVELELNVCKDALFAPQPVVKKHSGLLIERDYYPFYEAKYGTSVIWANEIRLCRVTLLAEDNLLTFEWHESKDDPTSICRKLTEEEDYEFTFRGEELVSITALDE